MRTRREPILPGEAVEVKSLVDSVVEDVNHLYLVKGLETAREIGEYILSRFFDGDPAKFHERGRKHVSFRRLAEREDLAPSYSFLWNACAVVEQLRLLPEQIREALPLSHHKLLLPVKDEATKIRLAQRAVEDKLSKRALATEIKKSQKREAGGVGRRPLPTFVKGLTRLAGVVKLTTSDKVTAEVFATYPPDKAKTLVAFLEGQIDALVGLKSQVEQALGEWEKNTWNAKADDEGEHGEDEGETGAAASSPE